MAGFRNAIRQIARCLIARLPRASGIGGLHGLKSLAPNTILRRRSCAFMSQLRAFRKIFPRNWGQGKVASRPSRILLRIRFHRNWRDDSGILFLWWSGMGPLLFGKRRGGEKTQ